ncbi:hypothetical protein, variant [Saprolegnia diclina VS20]|nr:hypothetical protein, variant [Saprolegnia diclina VS20]EQC36598.1 hypothetical protein, variant [Saprolegnia diclina VS20]|eukprot:XP_008610018.1 hypothetical protein, variant [Saprolegnia diclina VS20]
MYLGDRVQVESLAFGPVQANVATSWTRKRMNPFYFATPSAMTSPARSDVFYFNEKNALVGHHRLLLGSVLTPDNHYKNQLVDHVVLRERASIRTTLHKVVIVPSLYKYNRDVLLDAIDDGADDIVRLLVDHGADIKGVCSDRLLARALDQSDVETAIYALKHGADVQSRIELARMVLAGNDAMLEVLVNAGAYLGDPCDLHKYIRCGRRCPPTEAPLVAAYTSNQPRMAQLLLDLHAPIDVAQKAAPRNCLLALCLPHLTDECARRWHILQLLERGAATMMHKPNQDGMTPYELATAMGATTIRKSFDLYTKSSAAKLADDGPVDDNCASPAGSSALSYTYDSDASDDVLDQ